MKQYKLTEEEREYHRNRMREKRLPFKLEKYKRILTENGYKITEPVEK